MVNPKVRIHKNGKIISFGVKDSINKVPEINTKYTKLESKSSKPKIDYMQLAKDKYGLREESDNDSDDDGFGKQAKTYLTKHVKIMFKNPAKSRQPMEECKSNLVLNPKSSLMSFDKTKGEDFKNDNQEDEVASFTGRMSKEQLFQLLYSKDYSKEPSPARYKVLK